MGVSSGGSGLPVRYSAGVGAASDVVGISTTGVAVRASAAATPTRSP